MADNLSGVNYPALNFMDFSWGDGAQANYYGTAADASAADSASSAHQAMTTEPQSYLDTLLDPYLLSHQPNSGDSPTYNRSVLSGHLMTADIAAAEAKFNETGKDSGLTHWKEPTTYIAIILALIVIAVGLFAIASSSAVSSAVGAIKSVK